jgi:hypothetical protein
VRLEERFKVKSQFVRPVTKQEPEALEIIKKADEERSQASSNKMKLQPIENERLSS